MKRSLYVFTLLAVSALSACRSSDSASEQPQPTRENVIEMVGDTTNELTSVLKSYQNALLYGDSATALSLATGKALSILEYRFYKIEKGVSLLFEYGAPSVRGDTGYVPFSVRRMDQHDTATSSRAVLLRTDSGWKVERVIEG